MFDPYGRWRRQSRREVEMLVDGYWLLAKENKRREQAWAGRPWWFRAYYRFISTVTLIFGAR